MMNNRTNPEPSKMGKRKFHPGSSRVRWVRHFAFHVGWILRSPNILQWQINESCYDNTEVLHSEIIESIILRCKYAPLVWAPSPRETEIIIKTCQRLFGCVNSCDGNRINSRMKKETPSRPIWSVNGVSQTRTSQQPNESSVKALNIFSMRTFWLSLSVCPLKRRW